MRKLTIEDAEALEARPRRRDRAAGHLRHGGGRGRRARRGGVLVVRRDVRDARECSASACGRAASCRPAIRGAGARSRGARARSSEARALRRRQPARRARAHRRPPLPRHRRHGAEGPDSGLRHGRPRPTSRWRSAQSLFNRDELIGDPRPLLAATSRSTRSRRASARVLMERHDGEEDFTITTQTEMLDVLDRVLRRREPRRGGHRRASRCSSARSAS